MTAATKLAYTIPVTAELWGDLISFARFNAAVAGDTEPADPIFAAWWRSVKDKPARMIAEAQAAWPDHDWSEFL
jgi:hypothetical protein